jgi:hypothetical protein
MMRMLELLEHSDTEFESPLQHEISSFSVLNWAFNREVCSL